MAHVALHIHLRFFPVRRRGQRDDAKHPRAGPLGDRLDDAALAGAVAALEHDADLEPLGDDPQLKLDQLGVRAGELALVNFVAELFPRRRTILIVGLAAPALTFCRTHAFLPCSFFTSQSRLPSKAAEGSDVGRRCAGVPFAAASQGG